ncbi:MAG: hypothetical protein Q4C49_14365 [Bacillota bacterium]|nr:hypothetical protein [Bacillota bacterium]
MINDDFSELKNVHYPYKIRRQYGLVEADESNIGEVKLTIEVNENELLSFVYGEENGKFWFYTGVPGEFTNLSYPENIEENCGLIEHITKNNSLAEQMAKAIKYHYENSGRSDIERTVFENRLKYKKDRIEIVLYDPFRKVTYFIFNVDCDNDFCTLMTAPTWNGTCSISLPLISQLNYYYGHCTIIKNHPLKHVEYKSAKKTLEKKSN